MLLFWGINNHSEQELIIWGFELFISNGWFAFILELMGPSRVIGEVLEYCQLWRQFLLIIFDETRPEKLFDYFGIFMINTKHPDIIIVNSPVSEDLDNCIEEGFILKHPKNVRNIENTTIKNIFVFKEFQNLLFVARPQNIIKRAHSIFGFEFSNRYFWNSICFSNYWVSSTGICRINLVWPNCWEVENSFEFSCCIWGECYVVDLSVLMSLKGNAALRNIDK